MLAGREALAILPARPFRRPEPKAKVFADAEAYEGFMGRWSRLVAPLLVNFSAVASSGQVLDVGSGTGSLTFSIAERYDRTRVTGIDHSQQYVEYAKSVNPFFQRAGFQTGDAQALNSRDAAFDAALSLFVFNFIPDAAKLLAGLRRVIKPGGRISAAT